MNAMITAPQSDATYARAVILICAFAALVFGAFAALGSEQTIATVGIASVFVVAALILPLSWVALALAALIPLQLYFPFVGAFNLRGALVFVAVAALRAFVIRFTRNDWRSAFSHLWSLSWIVPGALFVCAAFIAALTALNRYSALKGIYDWLPVFATAFVIGEIVHAERLVKQIVALLIVAGVGEAILGLIQSALDVPRVVAVLQSPICALVYQPNLLRDRLSDLSFNWIVFDHVLPFGTFINGIDYAIFLAAILVLVLALLLGESIQIADLRRSVVLLICAVLLGSALLQTFKGSGMIALVGGIGVIALLNLPRVSPRLLTIGAIILLVAFVLVAPFYADIAQRGVFLVQRETGALFATGRTAIWAHLMEFLPQRLFFGWGLNNAALLVEPIPSMNGGAFAFNIPAAESAYVAALVETGIVGFAALLLFIAVILARGYRNAQATRQAALPIGIVAAFVAILCGSLTVVGLTTDQNGMLLGVFIGLIFSSVVG